MASSIYDDSSLDSNISQDFVNLNSVRNEFEEATAENTIGAESDRKFNIINKLFNRQVSISY